MLALVCFGLVMVFSTSSATALLNDGDPLGLAMRQGTYALVGLGAYAVMVRMQPETIRRLGRPALAISGFLLLVVLVPSIGMTVNGSRRWISLGGLGQLQPSELAKVALALWLAGYVAAPPAASARRAAWRRPSSSTGVLGLLILIEPDMGTATSLCVVALRDADRGRRPDAPHRDRRRHPACCSRRSRCSPSPTGASASSRSSTRGPTRTAPGSRASRPRSRSAPAGSTAWGSATGSRRPSTSPRPTPT